MSDPTVGRRDTLKRVGAGIAGAFLGGSEDPPLQVRTRDGMGQVPPKPPRTELVNVLEYEDVAKLALPAAMYSTIAGSDRTAFDRITFRPRMCVPVPDLDLTVDLFGDAHFTPILVGPVAEQRRYHQEGELATVRGASAARAAVVVSSQSSVPLGELATAAKTPLWYSLYAEGKAGAQQQLHEAVAAGCKAVCLTIGATRDGARGGPATRAEWNAIDQLRKGLDIPLLIKGVTTPQDAQTAIAQGARGIVVSNHGGVESRTVAPIDILSSIAEVVEGKAAVLVDGSFRRGSDILKALVLGAHGVLLARPVMWGLAAYGAEGVQGVIEMLQSDLARHIGALGVSNPKSLTRSMVKIHRK
jgi:4-hydroxymandelate oxidase